MAFSLLPGGRAKDNCCRRSDQLRLGPGQNMLLLKGEIACFGFLQVFERVRPRYGGAGTRLRCGHATLCGPAEYPVFFCLAKIAKKAFNLGQWKRYFHRGSSHLILVHIINLAKSFSLTNANLNQPTVLQLLPLRMEQPHAEIFSAVASINGDAIRWTIVHRVKIVGMKKGAWTIVRYVKLYVKVFLVHSQEYLADGHVVCRILRADNDGRYVLPIVEVAVNFDRSLRQGPPLYGYGREHSRCSR